MLSLALAALSVAAPSAGERLYHQTCQACHLTSGEGVPGVFPPLAGSDFLRDTNRVIRVLCEGLSGPVTVNGVKYQGVMPVFPLTDEEIAGVLTHVYASWGNGGGAVTPEQVARIREKSRLKSPADAERAAAFNPLPAAPPGVTLREVGRLPDLTARMILGPGGDHLLLLGQGGNLWRMDLPGGAVSPVFAAFDYLDSALPEIATHGICLDPRGRLLITANQRDPRGAVVTNRVSILRAEPRPGGGWEKPAPWYRTAYPFGIGPFNHALNHIAVDPAGRLVANSGARTDGNEPGRDPRYFQGGEVENTACLWRLDPESAEPRPEIFARGLRNAYGFTWDDRGRLVATENGPNADAPEELNVVESGAHHGFPFRFADWTTKPYPHTPDAPPGLAFTLPVLNRGPAGGAGLSTFEPHSCPSGIVFLGEDFPDPWRGSFLVARFGNLLAQPRDTGFDLLRVRLSRDGARWVADTDTVLAPLARPLDLVTAPGGRVYLLEYSRHLSLADPKPQMPGRVLELLLRAP